LGKKLRVFQVARELSISNEAVIDFLGKKSGGLKSKVKRSGDDRGPGSVVQILKKGEDICGFAWNVIICEASKLF